MLAPVTAERASAGSQNDDTHSPQLKSDKRKTSEDPNAYVEAFLKIFIRGGDIESAEDRNINIDHQGGDSQYPDVQRQQAPVRSISSGRHGQISDGTELRSEDAQAGRPPGNSASRQEKILGGFLPLSEIDPHADQQGQVTSQNAPVEPSGTLGHG